MADVSLGLSLTGVLNTMTSSDIEKENLEAHVELCAERYKQLNLKLDTMNIKVSSMELMITDIRSSLAEANDKHNRQLITIGSGLILTLIGAIVTLLVAIKH